MEFSIAQTNLQLYRQMMQSGADEAELSLANRAYLLASRLTSGVLRGSGKPFACHLVGTASVVVECGLRGPCVAAALLHAVYQDRVPFPGDRSLEQRREYLRMHFGPEVEHLVHAYHLSENASLEEFSDEQLVGHRTVVVLRLADEIDELVDDGTFMHGRPDDDASIPGSAARRLARFALLVPEWLRISRVIAAPSLQRHFEHFADRALHQEWPPSLRTGQYSSYVAHLPTD